MTGKTDLTDILKNLNPVLNKGTYVFVTVDDTIAVARSKIIGEFKEKEGKTLILEQKVAEDFGFTYHFKAAWITLNVHSSLQAVGLIASVSTMLAKNNIACNCIAGYYHDHLFVPKENAQKAVHLLQALNQ